MEELAAMSSAAKRDPGAATHPIQQVLERLHARFLDDRRGALASYIPELAAVDPDPFGIALVTIDGMVYEAGDTGLPFTIQSISKPFFYGYALRACGVGPVLDKIGVEPTGDAFNSISLEAGSGRPRNPMVNAGAIATCGLLHQAQPRDAFARVLEHLSAWCGRELRLNEAVYRSEKATGHRNRAIAHLLRNFGILEGDPEDGLDLYFRLCSVEVRCRDLAVMAAGLAHNGLNPLDERPVLGAQNVRRVLSVMASCGMYDGSGAWLYDVGMPAKSGVGGGVLAVLPGQFGLAVFSPRLDEHGNSVRGLAVVKAFSQEFQLHLFHGERGLPGAIRAQYSGAVLGSRAERSEAETAVLEAHGEGVRVFELKGRLSFGSIELLIRQIGGPRPGGVDLCVIDLQRVTAIDDAASLLLAEACLSWGEESRHIALTGAAHLADFLRHFGEHAHGRLPAALRQRLFHFADIDAAMEWAESAILEQQGCGRDPLGEVPLERQELLLRLEAGEVQALRELVRAEHYAHGTVILGAGAGPCDRLYFLVSGKVSVNLPAGDGAPRMRLSLLWPGSAFGEIAMLEEETRAAEVVADTGVSCLVLELAALRRLPAGRAEALQLKLTQGLARLLTRRLRRVNREFRALA
jgi:glutaminase